MAKEGYVKAGFYSVRFRFVFLAPFIISTMAGFVFGFVFSTATCYQQVLGFVLGSFGFVF